MTLPPPPGSAAGGGRGQPRSRTALAPPAAAVVAVAVATAAGLAMVAALLPVVARTPAGAAARARLERLAEPGASVCPALAAPAPLAVSASRADRLAGVLASWQTVAGSGAGSVTGIGAGRPSAALLVDHTRDDLRGPVVLGGVLGYPGAENAIQNYRSPSATLHAYLGHLLGPLVPAAGLSATGFLTRDRDRGQDNLDRPPFLVAANGSVELATEWVASLAGFSVPFAASGLQPWRVGLGPTFAPF